MADYQAVLGEMDDQSFRGDGNIERFQAGSEVEAIAHLRTWAGQVSILISKATHARLQKETGTMKRRLVGIWPLSDLFEASA